VMRGRYYSRDDLDTLLAKVAALVQTPSR